MDTTEVDLYAGWNLISFIRDVRGLDEMATDDAIDQVLAFDPLSASAPWRIATRDAVSGQWTSQTAQGFGDTLNAEWIFWFHANGNAQLTVSHTSIFPPESIPLTEGWSPLPFIPDQLVGAEHVYSYLAPIQGKWLGLARLNSETGEWEAAAPPDADLAPVPPFDFGYSDIPSIAISPVSPEFQFMEAGTGYYIYMLEDAELVLRE